MPADLLHTHHGGMILPLPERSGRPAGPATRRGAPPLTALRMHSVTWNMGRTKPTHDLASYLRGEFLGVAAGAAAGAAVAPVPDVIVVGTQENAAPGPWLDLLQGVLRPEGYVLLRGAASMNSAPGGSFVMTIAAFVRRELEERFSDVLVGRVTCGLGNKVRPRAVCGSSCWFVSPPPCTTSCECLSHGPAVTAHQLSPCMRHASLHFFLVTGL